MAIGIGDETNRALRPDERWTGCASAKVFLKRGFPQFHKRDPTTSL